VPSPLGAVTEYWPTPTEIGITAGIWALGAWTVTVFFKIAVAVREDAAA